MDPDRFDSLVLSLARRGSRRRLLGAALAVAAVPATASAKHRKGGKAKCLAAGKRCKPPSASAPAHLPPTLPGAGKQRPHQKDGGRNRSHGGAGAGDAGLQDTSAGARKGKNKHRAPSCAKCCSGSSGAGADGKTICTCVADGDACATSAQCCGSMCRSGICTGCPPPQVTCDGACFDLRSDEDHCGFCDVACEAEQRCQNGTCVCDAESCPNGCCDAATATCKRGTNDGACGDGGTLCLKCNACQTCDGATCVAKVGACCDDGNGTCQNGQCVSCASGQRCQDGTCVCDDQSSCAGCCAGTACQAGTDNSACGREGEVCVACSLPETCGGGGQDQTCGCAPATSCPAGQLCGAAPDGCGGTLGCGTCDQNKCLTCGAGNICVAAGDNSDCGNSGLICCGGACTNSNFDNSNCGECGQTCSGPLGVTCFRGVCCQSLIGPTAPCSASVPCCANLTCSNGFCCRGHNQHCDEPSDCCSGDCDTTNGVCN